MSLASSQALAINSFEPTVWKRLAIKPEDAAKDFANFLRRHATVDMVSRAGKPYQLARLVAHNAAFDGPFLIQWFADLQLFLPAARSVYCTLQRAYWMFQEDQMLTPPSNYKLGTLCEYFGVRLADDEAHDAIADVRATVQLYRAMIEHARPQSVAA
ncbi:MAG: 3'-5' exonuclease [Pirellulaceae bacterium]